MHQPYFDLQGWESAYPETTGYIIPTLYAARDYLAWPELGSRAVAAANWEIDVQLGNGAVQGGVIGQTPAPVVFNTGMVIFGWLSAFTQEGDGRFADAARRAARFLMATLDDDGIWRRGNSPFTLTDTVLYNARVAWALAEVGTRLDDPKCTDAAARALNAVAKRQRSNAWIPDCCLTEPDKPLLHTIAYAIRGLLEGGRTLGDSGLINTAACAASVLASEVDTDGRIAGRFDSDWNATVPWSCLTGNAQMAGIWIRLCEVMQDELWLEPVGPALRFLKSTQNREAGDEGLRGGIKGSNPIDGDYGRCEMLSWATKFFVDAMIRHDRYRDGWRPTEDGPLALA
jgi:hypothetical protein